MTVSQASEFVGSAGTFPAPDICSHKTRHTLLSQGYPIVLQEDDLEPVAHTGIVVDDLTDGRDEFDDHLGHVVARGCLKKSNPETVKAFKKGRGARVGPHLCFSQGQKHPTGRSPEPQGKSDGTLFSFISSRNWSLKNPPVDTHAV